MKWFFYGVSALVLVGLVVGHLARLRQFKPGDPITISQCTRGYWHDVNHGKYTSRDFRCTHRHVTLKRMR